jgi:chemotaxis signal transduction protein
MTMALDLELDLDLAAFDSAAPTSTATRPARILTTRSGARFALAAGATLEIIEQPQALPVPGGAAGAIGLLPWRDGRIALIDPDGVLGAPCPAAPARYALVVAFQSADGGVEHGALALDQLPQLVMVSDSQACAAPPRWAHMALACFAVGEEAIAVLPVDHFWRRQA